MVWIWGPLCAISALILLLGCFELVLGPGYLVQVNQLQDKLIANGTADRLLIFIVDGLRNTSGLTPPNGSSHGLIRLRLSFTKTTVVALASGRYDPITSTVFGAPSESDNIFNYANRTYFFGPDSTPLYFGDTELWVRESYPAEWIIDYPGMKGRTEKPDQYVMDRILKTFEEKKREKNETKIIYLIQLVTIDLAAKAEGVRSTRVTDAILGVESYIARIQKAVESYYDDNKTAYIMISGHGTDDFGKSGGSSVDELYVPIFVWGTGSGRAGQQNTIRPVTDLCPLVAAILGIPTPKHSRGKLPKEFVSSDNLPQSLAYNGIQLGALCRSLSRSAGPLTKKLVSTSLTPCLYNDYTFNLTYHLERGNYEVVVSEATNLIEISHACIGKLEGFYSGSLLFTLAMSYLAWIGLLCSTLAPTPPPAGIAWNWIPLLISVLTHLLFFVKILLVALVIWIESWPWYLLPVFELPIILWWTAVARSERLWLSFCQQGIVKSAIIVGSAFAIVEVVYWTEYRLFFGVLFFVPYVAWTSAMNSRYVPTHVSCIWIGSSVVVILFPTLLAQFNESGKPSPAILNVGAAIWIIGGCLCAYRMDLRAKEHIVTGFLAASGTISIWLVDLCHLGVWEHWMRFLSWFMLFSPLMTIFGSITLSNRLMQVVLGLSVPLILVSVGQEPLCFLILSVHLYTWLRLEASSPQYQNQGYLRIIAVHFYLYYTFFILGPQPIIFTSAYHISPLFIGMENLWLSVGLTWCRLTLGASLITGFWTSAALYIGSKITFPFKCWLVLGAMSAARQCFAIVVSDEPNMTDLFLAHMSFFIVLIPFIILPMVLFVTKYKQLK